MLIISVINSCLMLIAILTNVAVCAAASGSSSKERVSRSSSRPDDGDILLRLVTTVVFLARLFTGTIRASS